MKNYTSSFSNSHLAEKDDDDNDDDDDDDDETSLCPIARSAQHDYRSHSVYFCVAGSSVVPFCTFSC